MNTFVRMGYTPNCSIYQRTLASGQMYYISYYLPNGKRVLRQCHRLKSEAKRLMRIKENELLQGNFDEIDIDKMPILEEQKQQEDQLRLDDALSLYLDTTSANRKAYTQYNDTKILQRLFKRLKKQNKEFLHEIKPLDIQLMFQKMNKEGKSEATLRTYARAMSKVFKWFIDDMEILEMKNPVKKITIPKKNGHVRDYLPSNEDIQSLITVDYQHGSSAKTPIQSIVKFLIFTGARLGEVLCAEWSDFDLEKGIWYIREKPKCPTPYGLGWSPKWFKNRKVYLFPEALEVLNEQTRYPKVYGSVPIRDESGKIIEHKYYPAEFVFPKRQVWFRGNRRYERMTRVDNISNSWKALKKKAGIENLQIKDLRTFFNYFLKQHCGLNSKEAGAYIGNSETVNDIHYSPINESVILDKIGKNSLKRLLEDLPTFSKKKS